MNCADAEILPITFSSRNNLNFVFLWITDLSIKRFLFIQSCKSFFFILRQRFSHLLGFQCRKIQRNFFKFRTITLCLACNSSRRCFFRQNRLLAQFRFRTAEPLRLFLLLQRDVLNNSSSFSRKYLVYYM